MGIERLKAASRAAGFAMANNCDPDCAGEPKVVFVSLKQDKLLPAYSAASYLPNVSSDTFAWLNPFARRETAS